jgi:hypothetical protein
VASERKIDRKRFYPESAGQKHIRTVMDYAEIIICGRPALLQT